MVFAVSEVSNSVSPDMKRIQRGKCKAMKKPKKNVTCVGTWWIMAVSNYVVSKLGYNPIKGTQQRTYKGCYSYHPTYN